MHVGIALRNSFKGREKLRDALVLSYPTNENDDQPGNRNAQVVPGLDRSRTAPHLHRKAFQVHAADRPCAKTCYLARGNHPLLNKELPLRGAVRIALRCQRRGNPVTLSRYTPTQTAEFNP